MGLIPAEHPEQLNPELEKVIMQTFSIVIVNEYDQQHNLVVPPADRRPYPYMATRYLQLQHPSRQGKTSGDGRSVWNGTVTSDDGVVWDVSSCGTGATCLSPAANINHKLYKTGDPSISYGCGLSDLDEGLEALFFSEVMHQNKIPTERLLAVISFPGSTSINVRAYPNLLRPSHFLRYLKQGNFLGLKRMADYYIARQVQNKVWPQVKGRVAYDYLLARFARDFARASAIFEDEYIFCWIDWDGDNILMDGGIIDYGSVRQFGLFHHEYRYDDVQRYSTNILEQRQKARELVQNFAQLVDFLKTGKKKPLAKFKRHPALKLFDEEFEAGKDYNLLYRIGLEPAMIKVVLAKHKKLVHHLRPIFTHFERTVSQRGTYKVSDGITSDAVFSMRDLLRELPQMYMALDYQPLAAEDFLTLMRSSYARRDDLQ
ncbi:MAG: hypothetical protein J6Y94_01295, partial [Bacteriovoracaceae bacterium]|nr:hypothetical protein [Bacteriovoracaceae bacterium]